MQELTLRTKVTVFLSLIVCGSFWGLSFLATTILLRNNSPIEVLSMRWMIAAVISVFLILTGKIKLDLKKKGTGYAILTGLVQPFVYSILETTGIKYTSTSESAIIIATIPCMVLIVGIICFKRPVNFKIILAIVMAFSGIVVCTCFSPAFSLGGKMLGYVLLFMATVMSGFYVNLSNKTSSTHSSLEITAFMSIISGVLFQLISFAMGNGVSCYARSFAEPNSLVAVLLLGVLCSYVCYVLLNYAISNIYPALASNVSANICTVVGVVSGIILAGDPFGWFVPVGLALTLGGVILSAKAS